MSSETDLSEKQAAPVVRRATPWWLKTLKILGILICLLAAAAAYLYLFEMPSHSAPSRPPAKIADTSDKIIDSIHRGMDYIERHQESDGHFSKGWLDPKPAFTALVVDALARSPEKFREKEHPFLKKAADAIIAWQQPNGSICNPHLGYDTYCTAMSVLALTALENPEYKPVIDKATKFLLDVQYKDDEINGPNAGGVGYTAGGKTSGDVSATWVESLKAAGVKEDDPAFKNAARFFSRLQNDPETNDTHVVNGKQIGSDGGFNYAPGESKVEEVKGSVHILWSYGLMSYQGLKSFMYMNVPKTDPRIQSAFRWVRENYTLEENRNIGADGLYYYYMTMAKALSLYGEPVIVTSDGKKHEWAKELSEKIISLQDAEGAWHNTASSRWMENDKVMVTSFAIRGLSICHEFLKDHPSK